jgi:hypothetical protein
VYLRFDLWFVNLTFDWEVRVFNVRHPNQTHGMQTQIRKKKK